MKKHFLLSTLLLAVLISSCTTELPSPSGGTSTKAPDIVLVEDFVGGLTWDAYQHVRKDGQYSGSIVVGSGGGAAWGFDYEPLPFDPYAPGQEDLGGHFIFQEAGSSRTANVSVYLNGKLFNPWKGMLPAKEWVNHLYGKNVRITFDASKDDQTNRPQPSGSSGSSAGFPYGWSNTQDFLPAADTTLYVPYPIRWLDGETGAVVISNERTPIYNDLRVRWNVDPNNKQGVFIVIRCPKQEGDTYPEIKNTPEIIIPIEVEDTDGSFLLQRKHFKGIPKHAQITIMLARGRYAEIYDKHTDDFYDIQFRTTATRTFQMEFPAEY